MAMDRPGLPLVTLWRHCVQSSCLALLGCLPEYSGILLEPAAQTLTHAETLGLTPATLPMHESSLPGGRLAGQPWQNPAIQEEPRRRVGGVGVELKFPREEGSGRRDLRGTRPSQDTSSLDPQSLALPHL